jgi:hypothetical protein
LCNAMMALLHILAYSSLSLSRQNYTTKLCPKFDECQADDWDSICISAVPIIVLGTCIILQAAIALAGVRYTSILTWNSSPLTTTAVLLRDGHVTRSPGRCMCTVLDTEASGTTPALLEERAPKLPLLAQPSAWESHKNIRRIVTALWVSVLISGACGGIIVWAWRSDTSSTSNFNTPGLDSWAFIPTNQSNAFIFGPSFTGSPIGAESWVICYLALMVFQGGLAMALHCSELIINLLCDEDIWRKAISKKGTKPANVIVSFFNFWPTNILRSAKLFLRKSCASSFKL